MRFSVVINNYNYARFLKDAIESVLNQSFKNYELIIVDDGSSDDSDIILEQYHAVAKIIKKSNGGQGSAYNVGFSSSAGELIIFLDADDVLTPDALQLVNDAWIDGSAKLQFRLSLIDSNGDKLPGVIPGSLHSGDVTGMIKKYGCYASSPGSGNVYSRRVLNKLLPMNESDWRIAADSYTINLAPFYGEVISLNNILGCYRIGDKPDTYACKFVFNNSPSTPWESYKRSLDSIALIKSYLVDNSFLTSDAEFEFTPSLCKIRMISLKFFKEFHPDKNDSLFKILTLALPAIWRWKGYSSLNKLLLSLWFLLVVCLPQHISSYAALYLVNPSTRKSISSMIRDIFHV